MEPFRMLSLEEAKNRILESTGVLGVERVATREALGRFAASDLAAAIDLPPFDNSAMDGYAVRSEDLKSASSGSPVALRCVRRIAAGDHCPETLARGDCARVFTGSSLPPGANAVVMQEDTRLDGGLVWFSEPVKPFENVRLRGEDLRAGAVFATPGQRLAPQHLAILAATGGAEVAVFRSASAALIATGNELREPGVPLGPGELYESNRVMIGALLRGIGGRPVEFPILRDDLDATVRALGDAFDQHDLVISTGGVSVGEFDFMKQAFTRLGGRIELWRIALRPGKPFVFGVWRGKPLFGLPGNPVSALVVFLLLVRPAVLKMQGAAALDLPRLEGELLEPAANRGDRRHFARVRWEHGKIRLSGPQASHMIGSLSGANGLIDLAPGARLEAGARVSVLIWDVPAAQGVF